MITWLLLWFLGYRRLIVNSKETCFKSKGTVIWIGKDGVLYSWMTDRYSMFGYSWFRKKPSRKYWGGYISGGCWESYILDDLIGYIIKDRPSKMKEQTEILVIKCVPTFRCEYGFETDNVLIMNDHHVECYTYEG